MNARLASRVVAGSALVALGARISFSVPGTEVPQSAQTLAILLVGSVLGPALGVLALVGYLAAGAVGVPVFADGGSGIAHLLGPTGGYLAGFVVAAWIAGRAWRRRPEASGRLLHPFLGFLLAHLAILGGGWLRLAPAVGPASAYAGGVAPFLPGAMVKSVAALAVMAVWSVWGQRRVVRAGESASF